MDGTRWPANASGYISPQVNICGIFANLFDKQPSPLSRSRSLTACSTSAHLWLRLEYCSWFLQTAMGVPKPCLLITDVRRRCWFGTPPLKACEPKTRHGCWSTGNCVCLEAHPADREARTDGRECHVIAFDFQIAPLSGVHRWKNMFLTEIRRRRDPTPAQALSEMKLACHRP